ncbi:AMP-binding protein [Streptomyces sp. 1331.2]|uniref:AMP-binding protein n=1 Tax=Streptomyces sp. 1331.2 TaxID=1938835 RepID=UPI000BD8A5CB|nr:AMP-binding protein [Streptomyces sp. 1331.2]SOB81221.1 amino acid adenylation domain-containing protein [Streptomyces sp. 1331.2]
MTTTVQDTALAPAEARVTELGPIQRTLLGTGDRRLSLTVRIPSAQAGQVRTALSAALATAPVLGAELVEVPGLRIPSQRPATGADWTGGELALGTFRARVTDSWDGPELTLSCDAMFADTTSVSLLLAEVAQRLGTAGAPSADAPDYLAIAPGHLAMLREGELAEEERFWAGRRPRTEGAAKQLADAVPGRTDAPEAEPVALGRPLTGPTLARLNALAAETATTPADVARTALAAVLHRIGLPAGSLGWTGDARQAIGLPTVPGPFTQVVPCATAPDPTQGGPAAVRAQRAEDEQALAMLGGPTHGTADPTPELVFDSHGLPQLPAGWCLESWSFPLAGRAVFSLRVQGDAASLHVESAGPEQQDRLAAVLAMWSALLTDLVHRTDAPLAALRLLPEQDAAELAERLQAGLAAPAADGLVARFRAHAAAKPGAPACRQGDRVWTYAELDARAAAIAGRLDGLPVGGVVAVLADLDADLLAALLAVNALGGAFLPLSPQEPAARIADALTRSGAHTVVVGAGAEPALLPADCRALVLSELPGEPADSVTAGATGDVTTGATAGLAEPVATGPDALAYLLRTSGSTGVPKLVGVRRSSLENYLRWADEDLRVAATPLPVVSSPLFDASFKQTLGVLYAGGCVRLPAADRLDLAAVRAELAASAEPVTLNCVPSYLSALLAEEESAGPDTRMNLARVLLGGEPLDTDLLRRIWTRHPQAEVWNLYGPTEATATATAGRMTPGGGVHVGTGVAGAGLAVVDEQGMPVPDGVLGEVVVTGPGLAVGYLSGHQGDSPFRTLEIAGRRVDCYHTGDLGVLGADGTLRLFGRGDSQIKLNGWRIDLHEIEHAARRGDGVRDAVVVLDRRAERPCLRAFVTGTADADQVRAEIAAILPQPMVPDSVTVLERFDLTATGKVDRTALLARAVTAAEADPKDYDAEQLVVATAWREVIGGGWPRPDDEFFACGGHSLLLARLVNLLRAQGYEQLSLRQVVRRPTVQSIAGYLRPQSHGA